MKTLKKLVSRNASGSPWVDVGSDAAWSGVTLAANGGNVGIGTAAPGAKLQINDGNIANGTNTQFAIYGGRTNTTNAEYANIFFGERSDGDGAGSKISAFTGNNNYETALAFSTSKDISGSSGLTEAMRIAPSGNVGIGTTTPAEKLDINGNIRIPNNSSFVGASGSGDNFAYNNGTFNGNIPRYSISWVNLGSTAEAILSSVGGIKLLIGAANTGAYVDGTGIHSYSDLRLKNNIVPMRNILEKVLQMQGVTFNLKVNNQASFGFIAQDLEKEFPLAVNTGSDGYKSVNYAAMTSVLVEAIKELNAKVEKLETENTNLKSQVNYFGQLKAEVENLKKAVYGNTTVQK